VSYVHGDSDQAFPVGLFAIQPDMFAPFASKVLGTSISDTDVEALKSAMNDPKVIAAVQKDLDHAGKRARFAGFENTRALRLYLDPFTIENELMTPTLKLKRANVAKKFRSDLDELYAEALEKEAKRKGAVKAKL